VSARADDASVVERRRPIAVVSAVVVAAVLGFGVLSPVVAALGWQGYLVSGVGDSGPAAGAAVALALLVAAVSALVVAVLLTGVRRPSRD
jgi:amino acid transporter